MFYLLNILIQMKILLNNQSLNRKIRPFNDIGFIPTMGGIHKGHISLIERSKKLCKKTIVSIFINPKQFNNKKDFNTYPKNIKKDLSVLKKIRGKDYIVDLVTHYSKLMGEDLKTKKGWSTEELNTKVDELVDTNDKDKIKVLERMMKAESYEKN